MEDHLVVVHMECVNQVVSCLARGLTSDGSLEIDHIASRYIWGGSNEKRIRCYRQSSYEVGAGCRRGAGIVRETGTGSLGCDPSSPRASEPAQW